MDLDSELADDLRQLPGRLIEFAYVVHHDGPFPSRSQPRLSLERECDIVRLIEHFHVNGPPLPGLTAQRPRIAYTAIGMQTGRVFEGCGWGFIGAHTEGMNSSSYGYFLPLSGSRDAPTAAAITSFHQWRAEGVRLGHLAPNHLVRGHSDFNKPSCPGSLVYDAIVRNVPALQPSVTDVVRAHPTLRLGKGGLYAPAAEREAVRHLQRLLRMPDNHRTGYFGALTDSAVRAFQKANGLTTDGIVGKQTWGKLL